MKWTRSKFSKTSSSPSGHSPRPIPTSAKPAVSGSKRRYSSPPPTPVSVTPIDKHGPDTLTLTLPLPHPRLSPNGRSHHHAKAKQTKIHRTRARLRSLEALAGSPPPAFSRYTLAFFHATAHRRDDDNLSGSCKAYRDGIADALRMDDSHLHLSIRPTSFIDRENPRLEITLYP